MTLAERIKQIRDQKKMTQKEVASLMGISQQAYGQYESGTREPKKETIYRIADALGVSQFELLRPVMEHDADTVNTEWFAEMTEEDIANAMIPPKNQMSLYEGALLIPFHMLSDIDKGKVISYCQWLADTMQHCTKNAPDAAGPAADDAAEDSPKE